MQASGPAKLARVASSSASFPRPGRTGASRAFHRAAWTSSCRNAGQRRHRRLARIVVAPRPSIRRGCLAMAALLTTTAAGPTLEAVPAPDPPSMIGRRAGQAGPVYPVDVVAVIMRSRIAQASALTRPWSVSSPRRSRRGLVRTEDPALVPAPRSVMLANCWNSVRFRHRILQRSDSCRPGYRGCWRYSHLQARAFVCSQPRR